MLIKTLCEPVPLTLLYVFSLYGATHFTWRLGVVTLGWCLLVYVVNDYLNAYIERKRKHD